MRDKSRAGLLYMSNICKNMLVHHFFKRYKENVNGPLEWSARLAMVFLNERKKKKTSNAKPGEKNRRKRVCAERGSRERPETLTKKSQRFKRCTGRRMQSRYKCSLSMM